MAIHSGHEYFIDLKFQLGSKYLWKTTRFEYFVLNIFLTLNT